MTTKKYWLFLLIYGIVCGSAAKVAATPCDVNPISTVSFTAAGTITAGVPTLTTMTYTVGASGLQSGVVIALKAPDYWGSPNLSTVSVGGASYTSVPDLQSLVLGISGHLVTLTATGTVNAGTVIKINYLAQTCDTANVARFRPFVQPVGCSQFNEIFSTNSADTSFNRTAIPGPAKYVKFESNNLTVLTNTIYPITLSAMDVCSNVSVATGPITVRLNALHQDYTPDLTGVLSLSSTFSFSTSSLSGVDVTTVTTVYYRQPTTPFESVKKLQVEYWPLGFGYFDNYLNTTINNVTGGITNVSIDNGSSGSSSVSFSPDQDDIADFAYINFTLPSNQSWQVIISSNSNYIPAIRNFSGYGTFNRVPWNGNTDGNQSANPTVADPGTYYVKIVMGSLFDTSLTATLVSAGVKGLVLENGSATPIDRADIQVWGPSNRYIQTDSNGVFKIFGLQPGPYNLHINKVGYASPPDRSFTVGSGQLYDVGTSSMDKSSLLRVLATRPAPPAGGQDIWGNVSANSTDWRYQSYGTIHFGSTQTQSDAGDYYNGTPSTYTTLSLLPNVDYKLQFNIPGYGTADSTVTLITGEVRDSTVTINKRADIFGTVFVPAGANSTSNGMWISVEAQPITTQDPSKRFYGGVFLNSGVLSSTYTVYGVLDGTYTVTGRAPGLVKSTATAVVANGVNYQANLSTFTQGGVFSGTITINGDLSQNLNATNGILRLPISAWSPTTFVGNYQEILITTTPSQVHIATFAMTGLDDGAYDIYINLPGFETSPPGRKVGIVNGGTGNLNITFNQFAGYLSGNITLPGSNSDYSNVEIDLSPFRFDLGGKVKWTPDNSGNYSFSSLGTDFYTLRARYNTTGLVFEKSIQIVNKTSSTVNIDLSGNTFAISGRVTSSAEAPYNSLNYIVNQTTPTSLYNTGTNLPQDVEANRIVAKRFNNRNFDSSSYGGTAAPTNSFDPKSVFFGTYSATTGDYTILNLSPGVYLLSNNGEMDNNTSNGKEIAEIVKVITISTSDVNNTDFELTSGFIVSGRLTVDSGISEAGRNIQVSLKDTKGNDVVKTYSPITLTGTSALFSLAHVPPGNYALTAMELYYPKKYAAKDVVVTVISTHVTNQEIKLFNAGKVQGQLRVKTSGELLTVNNYQQLLPSNFQIQARSNPWFPGGYGMVENPIVGSDGFFTLTANPGTYDIILQSREQMSQDDIAAGKKVFVPVTLSGIKVNSGQTTNLGVVDLREGVPVSGSVTNTAGVPLANIRVVARSAKNLHHDDLNPEAFTNQSGSYTIQGLDPEDVRFYDIVAAPRPDSGDQRYTSFDGLVYGEARKAQVDTRIKPLPFVNFQLQTASGSISGIVTPPPGSTLPLILPFNNGDQDSSVELPGAVVILNKQGNIPQGNPLGDIEVRSDPNGAFSVRGLTPGNYDMWVLAKNYASATMKDIPVSNTDFNIGIITVSSGFKLTGTLTKTDGTTLNSNDYDTIIGARDGFQEIVVGQMNKDASGNIVDFSMAGFQSGKTYSLLLFGRENDVTVLASTFTLTGDTVQNFVVGDITPTILTQATKSTSTTQINLQFEFTQALRNSDIDIDGDEIADDSDPTKIILLKTGTGSLTFDPANWISSDRKRLLAVYTPAAGETSFVLTASATFVSQNSATGQNFSKVQDFTYYVGIEKQRTVRLTNAGGGEVTLDEDTSKFTSQAGTFGDDSDLEVNVQFRSADNVDSLAGQAPIGSNAVAVSKKLGIQAYPNEMAAAIQHVQAMDIEDLVFGTFYDIFLPAGVSHFFPTGKEAQLCVAYDAATVTDPYSLNVYYFQPSRSEYLLENTDKVVDTENERICVSIAHASVFTVLSSSQSIITGGGYAGDLKVVNYPNPFNLKLKTVTLQDNGAATQDITGTKIKMSIPSSMSGTVEIQIFNVAGELVRTLRTETVTSGTHTYTDWDGKNDHGEEVASGVYIGRFTIGGSNEKFFKMAVVK